MGAQQVALSNSGVADPCLSLEQKDDTQGAKVEGKDSGNEAEGGGKLQERRRKRKLGS